MTFFFFRLTNFFINQLSQVRALAARGNHVGPPAPTPTAHDKGLSDEGFPRGGSPPTAVTPTPTTVQQLLRRAQIRRNERRSPDPHDDTIKRSRLPSPPLNNNDATPTDFSMVKNHLSAKVEGNGLHDENERIEDNIKCEPLELTGGNGGITGHNEDSSDSGAAASDRPPASASSNEHDHEPPEHPSTPNFLSESKLFTTTPGSFNFSMAALTTDHNPLSGNLLLFISLFTTGLYAQDQFLLFYHLIFFSSSVWNFLFFFFFIIINFILILIVTLRIGRWFCF